MAAILGLVIATVQPAHAQRADSAVNGAAPSQPFNLIQQATAADAPPVTGTIDLMAADNGTIAESNDRSNAPSTSPVIQSEAATGNNALSSGNTTGPAVILGRRNVSDVGLAAIGVSDEDENTAPTTLDSLIWRGTSATTASQLLEKGVVTSKSPTLSALSYHAVARQSVPPTGANIVARDLVEARLGWLASAGRSNDLAVIAAQLPNDEQWGDWKKWLVQHQLMLRRDEDACRTVSYQVSQTFDPFWHKTKVICSVVEGNLGGARFGADILEASGVEDPAFFALVEDMLNGTKTAVIDPAVLSTIHITLMDAAHHEIPLEGMAILPPEMAQSTVALRYLGPDARMLSTFNALNLGLIETEQAAKLWRNIAADAALAELALARHVGAPDGLTTAMAWRALDAEKSARRLPLIAAAMDVDMANGNASVMRPLYTELAETGLAFERVERTLSEDQSDAAAKIALLLALGNPSAPDLPLSFPSFSYADNAAKILASLDGDSWRNGDLAAANQWHLMPLFEAIGMVADQSEWLDQAFGAPFTAPDADLGANNAADNAETQAQTAPQTGLQSISLSPLLLRAIQQASEKRRVAETILLANWLFGATPLAEINTNDAAIVITAINDIGQTGAANALAREIVIAHLLANTGGADMSAQTGAWIFPSSEIQSDQPAEAPDDVDNTTNVSASSDNGSLISDDPSPDTSPDTGPDNGTES